VATLLTTHDPQLLCISTCRELGFDINCSNEDAMIGAMAFLKSSGCASDCSSPECTKNYLIVQAHHDYCPEDIIPQGIEDGFHDYDEQCVACDIDRIATEGAVDCPMENCDDNSGNDAYASMIDAGCATDCSSDVCKEHYFTLRVTHDRCEHDTLSRSSEEGLHDMEVSCVMHVCNVVVGAEDEQLVCEDDDVHDGHDHGEDDHSSGDEEAKTLGSSGAVVFSAGGVIFFGVGLVMVA